MSKRSPRLPTPRSRSSPVQMEKTGSGSSRKSDSPIHWETLLGANSPRITKAKPSSWDNSDDELPLTHEGNISRGHIYSSETLSNRKSVAAEINELKKQFFQAVVTETVSDIEDLKEKLETSLRNDRRQSPARVRRRTKSSSSSSTVMDATLQGSPKKGDEFNSQYEAIFDNVEDTAPVLELDSRFYLDNFFAEIRRKRISILESTIGIANERNEEDFQEIALEDPDEFVNLNDCGYYNRSSRKLSQILEVEENKKDSDKDSEECTENTDLFLRFPRKVYDSDRSPLHTARSKKDEKFENLNDVECEFQPSWGELKNSKKGEHELYVRAIAKELGDEVISLTAKTGSIQLTSPRRKNSSDLHQIHDDNDDDVDDDDDDDDVNWSLIENLKLDLMKSPENSTPRKSSIRERNSGSGSRRSTRDGSLQSPKFMINLGKESARSLKVEEVKTPNSSRKDSVGGSDRSVKDNINSCRSAVQENILLDLKSSSLGSQTSNQSLELQNILLDEGISPNKHSQRSNYAKELRDRTETPTGSELPYRSNRSESSCRSLSTRSNKRLSSRATESRRSSQKSDRLEPLERVESRRSFSASPKAGLELRLMNSARSEKSCANSSKNKDSKSTPRGIQTTTPPTSRSYVEDIITETKGCCDSFNNGEGTPDLLTSEWIDLEKVHAISSNRSETFSKSQLSSRSELIASEIPDKAIRNDFTEEQGQHKNSSRKSVITENSDNLDDEGSSRSIKDKSGSNSRRSEERTSLIIPLNTERSDEVKISGRRTKRIEIVEESEDSPIHALTDDSESERRLSVINEVSSEDTDLGNFPENSGKLKRSSSVGGSEEENGGKPPTIPPASHRSVKDHPNESIIKPESEGLWNDLIETFSADQNQPFNWQDKFLSFLNTNQNSSAGPGKGPSSRAVENTNFLEFESDEMQEEGDDKLTSTRRTSTKNVRRFPQISEKISTVKNENFMKNMDLEGENNLTAKIKGDNDAENFYYLQVEKTGNFGIGEFGDHVTCWNLGVPLALEGGKPKGDGDGMLSQRHIKKSADNKERNFKTQKRLWTNLNPIENHKSKVQKSFPDDLNSSFFPNEIKTSKSDNCIQAMETNQTTAVDFLTERLYNSNSERKPFVFENSAKKKRRVSSSVSSMQYSSSECETDETDFDFDSIRRTASLTNITAQLRRGGYEKLESNENLYNSRTRLFEKVGKGMQDKDTTNLNIFLARKKEDRAETKTNWLIIKQSRGKTCHRENKKSKSRLKIDRNLIKKDSKEYLSFKSRPSIPVLKLRDTNCFQNFYKRVISVFCLTSNSSLPTSN